MDHFEMLIRSPVTTSIIRSIPKPKWKWLFGLTYSLRYVYRFQHLDLSSCKCIKQNYCPNLSMWLCKKKVCSFLNCHVVILRSNTF